MFCENCGRPVGSWKATVQLKDDTARKARRAGLLCRSRFHSDHFSAAGIAALYRGAGVEPPLEPMEALRRLVDAGGKVRAPARVLGQRQHKQALVDFNALCDAYKAAKDALEHADA